MVLKVVHVVPSLKIGGGAICVLRFIRGSGNLISNYLISNGDNSSLVDEAKQLTKGYKNIKVNKVSFFSFVKFVKYIYKVRPDIIHTTGKSGIFFGLLSWGIFQTFFKVKYFHTYHGFHPPEKKFFKVIYLFLEKIYFKMCVASICVSNSELSKVKYNLNLKNVEGLIVIENGICIKPDIDIPSEIKSRIDAYTFNIVSLSRIHPQKDLHLMLDCFDKLGNCDCALHIFGGMDSENIQYYDDIIAHIKTLKYSNNVFLWGNVPDAASLLNNFSLYFSTAKYEGLPTGIIEAGLKEIPIVATPCVGNIDLIDSSCGYLADSMSLTDVSEALSQAISDISSFRIEKKVSSCRLKMNKFTVERNVNKTLDLYRIAVGYL